MCERARARVFAHKRSVFFSMTWEMTGVKKKNKKANKDAQYLLRIIKMYDCLDQTQKSEKTVGGLVRGRKSRG